MVMKKRDTLKNSALNGGRGLPSRSYSLLSYMLFAEDFGGFAKMADSAANQFSNIGNLLPEPAAP